MVSAINIKYIYIITRLTQRFSIILGHTNLWHVHYVTKAVLVVVSFIVVIGALTHCALLHSKCTLKAAQMNMQHSLIWVLMLYKLKLVHNATELTKNICCAKSESAVNHSTVTRG